ncbi:hypothetical protein DGWBC_0396 [Dehalogenimonas sp. WBC-2]|nr:hypothetical protein DGWBC_0396 [Dehalogenimonas sp. WBC-2]
MDTPFFLLQVEYLFKFLLMTIIGVKSAVVNRLNELSFN